jgi:hypothetical protein
MNIASQMLNLELMPNFSEPPSVMATTAEQPIPSHMRPVPGSFNIPVAKFPSVIKPAPTTNPGEAASKLVDTFNHALEKKDFTTLSNLFVEGGYWRDHLALTWVFRTASTPPAILDFLQGSSQSRDGFRLRKIALDTSTAVRAPKISPLDLAGEVLGIQFFITVETVIGTGTGLVSLVEQEGAWKIFTLYTRLEELRGHEEALNGRRVPGVQHGGRPGRKNWAERRQAESDFSSSSHPAVIIVGKSLLFYC